jgi:WD40 repeat protein
MTSACLASGADAYGDPLPEGAVARLGTTRFRIPQRSQLLGFGPGDRTLAVYDRDGALMLLDSRWGKVLRRQVLSVGPRREGVPDTVVLSGDARTAVYRHPGGYLVVLDLENGKELSRVAADRPALPREFRYGGAVLRLSHDGRLLAVTFDRQREFRGLTWVDTTTGKRLRQVGADDAGKDFDNLTYHHPAFSRDGKLIAALTSPVKWKLGRKPALAPGQQEPAEKDRAPVIHVWDVVSGKELYSYAAPPGPVTWLAFLPGGKSLLAAGVGKEAARVLDAATGKVLRKLVVQDEVVESSFLSPDGAALCVVAPERVSTWDVAGGKQLASVRLPWPGFERPARFGAEAERDRPQAVLSADGKFLATAGLYHLRVWELASGQECRATLGHLAPVASVAFAPDGNRLLTAGADLTVCLWRRKGGKELATLLAPARTAVAADDQENSLPVFGTQALFWPDGKEFATVWPGRPVNFFDPPNPKTVRELSPDASLQTLARSPDGRLVATGAGDGLVQIWDHATGKKLREMTWVKTSGPGRGDHALLTGLVFSPDGRSLAACGVSSDDILLRPIVRMWEVATGGERAVLDLFPGVDPKASRSSLRRALMIDQVVLSVAFSPDGKQLAVGGGTTVYLWDVVRRRETRQMGGGHVFARGLAFSPDGRVLAAGRFEGGIRLWDAATGLVLRDVPAHQAAVTALAFSLDGRWLASASLDTTALVWDVAQILQDAPVLSAAESAALWKVLSDPDARQAFRTMGELAEHPARALALAKGRLRPAAAEAGPWAVSTEDEPAAPGLLAALRLIEVLERVGSPAACEVLEDVARGAAGPRVTDEARAALRRLRKRAPS